MRRSREAKTLQVPLEIEESTTSQVRRGPACSSAGGWGEGGGEMDGQSSAFILRMRRVAIFGRPVFFSP